MKTPLRKSLYKEISSLCIEGKIIDLGGSRESEYHELIKGKHTIDVVNIDDKYGYDLKFDLEENFQVSDSSYDAVLAFNVLEHIYNYRGFVSESFRILKKGGVMIIGVPFIMQIHPCPHDYWRYSGETLERILTEAGFKNIVIKPLGKGPISSVAQLLNNILKISLLRMFVFKIAEYMDWIINKFISGYSSKEYPLGYYIYMNK